MKTSELIGPALDWAVAKCERVEPGRSSGLPFLPEHRVYLEDFLPSYSWAQGGPIIEREKIDIKWDRVVWMGASRWTQNAERFYAYGSTPLIAAMRCYVASKLGDDIDIPEKLKWK